MPSDPETENQRVSPQLRTMPPSGLQTSLQDRKLLVTLACRVWYAKVAHRVKRGLADKRQRRDGGSARVGWPEPRSTAEGLAFTQASHWCAAKPFEGIINTFWLLWSSCHRKYNLHQEWRLGGPFLLSLPGASPLPPTALGRPAQSNPLIVLPSSRTLYSQHANRSHISFFL